MIDGILAAVPDEWLAGESDAAATRAAYARYLRRRLEAPRAFAMEAADAR
ncbi:MAG: hypothetical protein QM736_07775 [Vicinamibacterales bacterium]